MAYTHYPKNSDNLVFAWVQPSPPNVGLDEDRPDFLGRPFSDINRFSQPISPGESVVGYHDAQPFTRFYGSVFAADTALEVVLAFSNEEVDEDGNLVDDKSIGTLHYDAEALRLSYDPSKQGSTGKFFCTIYGRFLRVEVKNTGNVPTTVMRVFVRGSVF